MRAVVDFIVKHPNIGGGVSFHTHSGVILRPLSTQADDEMHAEDLWLYKLFGKKSTELTGYPNISIFHDFKYHPKQVITGAFDWLYEHQGAFFWTVEIWAPVKEAGVESYHFIDWYREHPPEDDLKLIAVERPGAGRPGLRDVVSVRPPAARARRAGRLEQARHLPQPAAEVHRARGEALPRLDRLAGAHAAQARAAAREVEPLGGDTWRVRIAVQNSGYLPSYVSKRALERKITRGVVYEIDAARGRHASSAASRRSRGRCSSKAARTRSRSRLSSPTCTSPPIAARRSGRCAPRRARRSS